MRSHLCGQALNEFCERKLGFVDGHVDVKAACCDRLEYLLKSSAYVLLAQCPTCSVIKSLLFDRLQDREHASKTAGGPHTLVKAPAFGFFFVDTLAINVQLHFQPSGVWFAKVSPQL